MLLAALALACDYDWTVAGADATWPTGQDARTEDGGAPDATEDATTEDAASGRDASTPDALSPNDCAALAARVEAERTAARRCALAAGDCATTVADPCGCDVFVADQTSAASLTYARSAAELARSGCLAACSACPEPPVTGTCLQQGPAGTLCWP